MNDAHRPDVVAVIEALGGYVKMAELLKVTPQAVVNWRTRGLPADLFLVITDLLAERGKAVAPTAFNIKQPEAAA